MKHILSLLTLSASSVAFAAFTPPASSVSTVSVNSSNVLVAPTASSFLSANPEFFPTADIKTLTFGTGLNTGSYAVTTAATASVDTTWLTNNYHKDLTISTGLTGSSYNGTAATTITVDTDWLSNNYHKTLTRGTGLTGDNYNGTTATTFAVNTTWLIANYHKILTRGTGLTGNNYNGTAVSTFAVDTDWLTDNYHKAHTAGTGLTGNSYNGTSAESWAVDTSWLTNNYHKTLTRGTGLTGNNYDGTAETTFAIDTTWLTDNYHKTLTRGTGLTGDNYNGTAVSTFAIDTTWLSNNYHKNLTISTGLTGSSYNGTAATTIAIDQAWLKNRYHNQLIAQAGIEYSNGTVYTGELTRYIQINKTYVLNWINTLKRDFYVYVDMELMFRTNEASVPFTGEVHLWYDTTAAVLAENVFYYKKADDTIARTLNSSGSNMPHYSAKMSRSRAIKPTDIELKVLDKYGNIVYYTATIMLNSSLIKSLHPEITDNSPTIYYFDNEDSNAGCYGTKTKFTNFNSYIGNSAQNISGIWVYPSISDATLCNGVARPRIPIYTDKATVSGYYPDTTKWGDYIRSVMENPENTIIVWRKSSFYPEEMPGGTNYWRPVQITHYGNFHD